MLRLESRPPNIEGKGEVKIRDLVRNSLRMRPDRIVVGEIRDAAALDMLQAMNTGHDGSICTVHANSPRDVLSRVETMVLMAGVDLPMRAIREQVSSAIDLIVHQSRFKDGTRHVTHVTEVVGMEGDIITLQDLFVFDHSAGFDENGRCARDHAVDRPAAEVPGQARRCRRHGRPDGLRLREVRAMTRRRLAALGMATALAVLLPAQVASADESGRIVEVKRNGDALRIVFQADGLPDGVALDPDSVEVRIADRVVASSARPMRRDDTGRRVAVLAIDNSRSMAGERLDAAKAAAHTFLRTCRPTSRSASSPSRDTTRTEVEPTADRAAVRAAIDGLGSTTRRHGAVRRRCPGGRPRPATRGRATSSCSPTATRTAAAPRPWTTPSREPPPTTSLSTLSTSGRRTSSRRS